jgi:uncharacterized protein (TIGR03067 family)
MRSALLIVAVGLLPTTSVAQKDGVKAELERLQGTWKLIERKYDGKQAPEEEVKLLAIKIVVKGDKVAFTSAGDTEASESTITVNPAVTPRTLDVLHTKGSSKGKKVLSIYKLEGDRLTVCNSLKERPTEFTAGPGSGRALLVFRREPK